MADQPQFATLNEYLLAHKLSVVEEEQEAGPWDFIETRGKLELPPEEEAKNEEIVESPNPLIAINPAFPCQTSQIIFKCGVCGEESSGVIRGHPEP